MLKFYLHLAVTCPQLSSPSNGLITCTQPYTFGKVCTQQCNKGFYRTQGTDTRQCMNDGTWSGQDLRCGTCKLSIVRMFLDCIIIHIADYISFWSF